MRHRPRGSARARVRGTGLRVCAAGGWPPVRPTGRAARRRRRLALAAAATADAEAAAIWRKNLDDRRTGMTMFAADLASTGELRTEHTVDTAADVLWLAMDVRNYDWLVRQRGWPPERFQRWYVDTVAAALFTPPGSPAP